MTNLTAAKILVDTGTARYYRYGYIEEITDTRIILLNAASNKFAHTAIALISVEDIEDATADEVEANGAAKIAA